MNYTNFEQILMHFQKRTVYLTELDVDGSKLHALVTRVLNVSARYEIH
jgi:hypothetical protein